MVSSASSKIKVSLEVGLKNLDGSPSSHTDGYFALRHFEVPATIMCDTRSVGEAMDVRSRKSLATPSIR